MTRSIRPVRVNHLNVVVQGYDDSVAHLQKLYGAEYMVDIPQKEWRACLVSIGRVILELFVPHEFLLNSRYGPHFLGIEYQADMDEVRAVLAEQGIRTVRDIGLALHTHPGDTFGVAFEFYGGSFHEREWPLLGGTIKPAEYWRNEHALGLTGLQAYTVAVEDIDAGQAFFQRFLSATVQYEKARPAIGAHAVGLQVADCIVEVLAATGEGVLSEHLRRFGQGIRSMVFGVRDVGEVRRYFAERGVATIPGGTPNSIAVPAEANRGLIFEFA